MTGPHAICRVTDEFVANCSHCRGGIVHLFGDHRCEGCGDLLDAGTADWQTPPPDSAVLCRTCHEDMEDEAMDPIAEVIALHPFGRRVGDEAECHCGWRGEFWPTHVAQAIREARVIRTVEELDALPMETMIRDNEGDPWLRHADAGWECHFNLARVGIADYLPALVLWTPGDEQ